MNENKLTHQQGSNNYDEINVKLKPNVHGAFIPMSKKIEDFADGIQLKQKYETLEELQGCEFPNIYWVYKQDKNKRRKGDIQFKWSEKTKLCNRITPVNCKSYQMNCYNYNKDELGHDNLCLKCYKECNCTYLCLNRQELKCNQVDSGEIKYLGKVTDPWDICNFIFVVWNDVDQQEYDIEASCFQCYFWCKCPCDGCHVVNFEIRDSYSKNVVGELTRKGSPCCSKQVRDSKNDCMDIIFPIGGNWRQRSLLMCAGIFIDFIWFEDTSSDDTVH